MTEMRSAEDDRRGIGINRWLQVFVEYMKYQKLDEVKRRNAYMMKEGIYAEFYADIEDIYTAAEYCLAGKKAFSKKGASGLRSGVSFDQWVIKNNTELQKYAKVLYDWIHKDRSRGRVYKDSRSAV